MMLARAIIIIICMTLLNWVTDTNGTYVLEIRARNYRNSQHKESSGYCCERHQTSNCDPWWCWYCHCDNRFDFCLRYSGSQQDGDTGNCPLGSYSTGVIGGDSFIFRSPITRGVPNPMIFTGQVWPGSAQFMVHVWDHDNIGYDDFVDDIYVDGALTPSDSFTRYEIYTGRYQNSQIELQFRLQCDPNFFGNDCSRYCMDTDRIGSGHYSCDEKGNKVCLEGWSNPVQSCTIAVCAPRCNPLGGSCSQPGECVCNNDWSGNDCSDCIPRAGCSNIGGYCNLPNECICRTGYEGPSCNTDVTPCDRGEQLCSNEGTCVNDGIGGYSCHCANGYEGNDCEREIDECMSSPCEHGGMCRDEINGFNCVCELGFSGQFCEEVIDYCQSIPCANNGNCTNEAEGFSCNCPDGFYGDTCEATTNVCATTQCENNGTCHNEVDNSYYCECELGFTGENCENVLTACESNPCANGDCTETPDAGYSCSCFPSWTGTNCDTPVNLCACENAGTCEEDFTGSQCETPIDPCTPNSCRNGGQCMSERNSFTCHCQSGFDGQYCEKNSCFVNPCENGGTCMPQESVMPYYVCNCVSGWTGQRCEIDINECLSQPCNNNGTCVDTGVNSYRCTCPDGWGGNNCDVRVGGCYDKPCQHGATCLVTEDNGFSCECARGFFGEHCEYEIDECLPKPCGQRGNCTDLVANYNCTCFKDYKGHNCQIDMNLCRSDPCENGGTCTNFENSYSCECPQGFTGDNCADIDDCTPTACSSQGMCVDALDDYVCVCFSGFTGRECDIALNANAGQVSAAVGGSIAGVIVLVLLVILVALVLLLILRKRNNKAYKFEAVSWSPTSSIEEPAFSNPTYCEPGLLNIQDSPGNTSSANRQAFHNPTYSETAVPQGDSPQTRARSSSVASLDLSNPLYGDNSEYQAVNGTSTLIPNPVQIGSGTRADDHALYAAVELGTDGEYNRLQHTVTPSTQSQPAAHKGENVPEYDYISVRSRRN